ncbi:MAG TPA: hypothetical protein VGW78_00700 [Candidatus Babeliales bacterium]|nr:hypothetical protein [Candidatus Babeliales bacterium]
MKCTSIYALLLGIGMASAIASNIDGIRYQFGDFSIIGAHQTGENSFNFPNGGKIYAKYHIFSDVLWSIEYHSLDMAHQHIIIPQNATMTLYTTKSGNNIIIINTISSYFSPSGFFSKKKKHQIKYTWIIHRINKYEHYECYLDLLKKEEIIEN